MSKHSEFVEFVLERMIDSGINALSLHARAMFGGYGIYHDGVMFALVADDELFLKIGAINESDFEAARLPRFSYQRQGKTFEMSYATAPVEMFDDPVEMKYWTDKAIDASRAVAKPAQRKR